MHAYSHTCILHTHVQKRVHTRVHTRVHSYIRMYVFIFQHLIYLDSICRFLIKDPRTLYSVIPGHRNHRNDPASVFLSTHWWSQHPACQCWLFLVDFCFFKPLRKCHPSQRGFKVQCKKQAKKIFLYWDFLMLYFLRDFLLKNLLKKSLKKSNIKNLKIFFERFYVDFLLDFMFFEEILCWRSFYKSLRNCSNRCQRVSNKRARKRLNSRLQFISASFYVPGCYCSLTRDDD